MANQEWATSQENIALTLRNDGNLYSLFLVQPNCPQASISMRNRVTSLVSQLHSGSTPAVVKSAVDAVFDDWREGLKE